MGCCLKKTVIWMLLLAMAFTTGCTLPGTNLSAGVIPDSTEGKDLTMGEAADSVFSLNINRKYSFNPLIATNHFNQLVCALVYENVVEVDNDFNVIPCIASEWEYNENGTTWILTIDNSHTFHDGSPVTAKDVRYSIDRAVSSDRFLGRFSTYQGAAQDGDDKLYITLGVGDTQFIKLLNIPVIKYGSYDEKFPLGSGPYDYVFEETPEELDEEGNVEIISFPNDALNLNEENNANIELNERNSEEKNQNIININPNYFKNSLGNNDIIEDNIKKTDTLNIKKKKSNDNENELVYEGDEDLDSNKVSRNKGKSKDNFRYHIKINQNILKYTTLITIIAYIIITIVSCVIFHIRRDTDPFLFCFEFLARVPFQEQDTGRKDIIYFLTDLNSFYIIHIILLFIFISVCYLLIKGNDPEIKDFFKDMSIFFFSTLLFNIPILFSGMFTHEFYGSFYQPVGYLILTFLGLLCMIKIFIVAYI